MGALAGCALTTLLLFCYYYLENRRRGLTDKETVSEGEYLSRQQWLDLTDKKNRKFRYVY
jgi:hypothetical protein